MSTGIKGQAVLFASPFKVELTEVEIPPPRMGEVLIQTAYSCISPGTELRALAGKQSGGEVFPFIPGYTASGIVIASGENTRLKVGTRVFCKGTRRANLPLLWGGHVSHSIHPEMTVIPLPDEIDLVDASILKLAGIAYHGLRHSQPLPHERVAVVGLGPIGQLSIRLHHLTGAKVVGADLIESRVKLTRAAGISAVWEENTQGIMAELREVFSKGVDVIVDATADVEALPILIELAHDIPWDNSLTPGARYLIQGSYPGDFAISYQAAFMKELQFTLTRDEQRRDLETVLELLTVGKLQVRDIITEIRSPDDAPRTYAELVARSRDLMTVAFQWSA
ncbi:MAG TPA: zinc-binding alcohol dehydrogenase [Phototrophicaceae bacterium]|nr:zinc-binding alcohol dehydrogenase [Phototrophicaceae bacterium]